MVDVPTPTIDMLIEWAQKNMGKEYLVDGRLVGKDIKDTFAPQAFGFHTPQHLCEINATTANSPAAIDTPVINKLLGLSHGLDCQNRRFLDCIATIVISALGK
jgi:hypothetical protein